MGTTVSAVAPKVLPRNVYMYYCPRGVSIALLLPAHQVPSKGSLICFHTQNALSCMLLLVEPSNKNL